MSKGLLHLNDASYATDVYHCDPIVKSENNPILIFIPGNPGLVGYYIDYLTSVQKLMPHFEILGISYAGFTHDDTKDPGKVLGLQIQADHKLEIIKNYVTKPRDVYIFGHSVGTYITQKMIKKMSDEQDPILDQVKFVGFITPTISEIGLSKNGVFMSKAFEYIPSFHVLISKVSYLTRLIPDSLIKNYLKWQLGTDSEMNILETKNLVQSDDLIVKSLGLAKEEMVTITKDHSLSEDFFKILSRKSIQFWGFFCHTDHWIHNDTRSLLIEKYTSQDVNFHIHDNINIKHSFCISSSEQFAEITQKSISK